METVSPPPETGLTLPRPNARERLGGAAVHVGAIFAPILFPIGAYLFARKKAVYVAAHARQSLVETLWLNVFIGLAIVISLSFTIAHVIHVYQEGLENVDWVKELLSAGIKILISYLLLLLLGFINTIVSIGQAIKAYRGEWPKSWKKKHGAT